jgi:hypothetical protein
MKTLLLLNCLLFSFAGFAQLAPVTVRTEPGPDRTYTIYAENKSDADYTVKLMFNLIGYTTNLSGNPGFAIATKGSSVVAKLSPDKMASSPTFTYTYQYFPGPALRKAPDTSVAYLLPGTAGNMLVVSGVRNFLDAINQKSSDNYFASSFMYQFGDTICATRAGTVYESFDGVKEGEANDQFYKRERNRLSVQHRDGTLSEYSMLAPIKLLVADGDNVVPGQPLAVFNKDSDKYILLYAVRYLEEKRLHKTIDLAKPPDYYIYLHPLFYTGESAAGIVQSGKTYTVAHNKEIIAKELSKKEKKKLGLQ